MTEAHRQPRLNFMAIFVRPNKRYQTRYPGTKKDTTFLEMARTAERMVGTAFTYEGIFRARALSVVDQYSTP